jgi:molybdopterin converting factor small subunit
MEEYHRGMVAINVELVGTLRKKEKKRSVVTIDEPATVLALAQKLGIISPSSSAGGKEVNSNPGLLILVDGKEISILRGLSTILQDGVSVTFVPVSHGG